MFAGRPTIVTVVLTKHCVPPVNSTELSISSKGTWYQLTMLPKCSDNRTYSLPKSGPVQTSYEEKLVLYALYKQGGWLC
jgi:hypothetical protein